MSTAKWRPFCPGVGSWWRHQMETFSVLLAICAGGNSPVPGEFAVERPVTRGFNIFFDLRLNKRLSKQSWGWWFETLSHPLWRHRNDMSKYHHHDINVASFCNAKWMGWAVLAHVPSRDQLIVQWYRHQMDFDSSPLDKIAVISQTIFSDAF